MMDTFFPVTTALIWVSAAWFIGVILVMVVMKNRVPKRVGRTLVRISMALIVVLVIIGIIGLFLIFTA